MPARHPLLAAARARDHVALARAIDVARHGDDGLEARDVDSRTALMLATIANDIPTARLLIEAGADVNARDRIDDSPYLFAGAEGLDEILKITLAHGADLASVNRYGGTALIPACHHGHVSTVKILLGTGIDIDHVNDLGWTALLETVILGNGGPTHTEIAGMLLLAGADPDIADRDGATPLAHALACGYGEIAQLLRNAGAQRTSAIQKE
jgi:ankyrin repeat protein